MLTGEYLVLDGAEALAVPTRCGQHIKITSGRGCDIRWKSYDPEGEIWFEAKISLFDFSLIKSSDEEIGNRLRNLLEESCRLNSDFLSTWKGRTVKATLDFSPNWGLGSSSSLVYMVAQWADVDPYELLNKTYGGSGYDIAAADAEGPIIYRLRDGLPEREDAEYAPGFQDQMYFVYLERKASTRKALSEYEDIPDTDKESALEGYPPVLKKIRDASNAAELKSAMDEHEQLIGNLLDRESVSNRLFPDFRGGIKSLGAWGGDFIWVVSEDSAEEIKTYFKEKGYPRIFGYRELVHQNDSEPLTLQTTVAADISKE